MPAGKANYIVAYKNHSQIYAAASKEVALSSPPPDGYTIEDKVVWFITCPPDTNKITVYKIPQEEVVNAEITVPKKKAKKDE